MNIRRKNIKAFVHFYENLSSYYPVEEQLDPREYCDCCDEIELGMSIDFFRIEIGIRDLVADVGVELCLFFMSCGSIFGIS